MTSRNSKLDKKEYRDAMVRANVSHGVSYQIKTIRKSLGLSQAELAVKIGAKSQSIISRLEDPSYGKISITTLEKIASAFDVALTVKFSSFGDFLIDIQKTIHKKVYSYGNELLLDGNNNESGYITTEADQEFGTVEYFHHSDDTNATGLAYSSLLSR
jgi:transcriptional regulator with XRE-family HTH domain